MLSLSVGCRHLKGSSEQNPEDEEPVPAGEEVKEQFFCPLDGGVAVDDATKIERRPLAVMIGNIPGLAEPSGVDKACLVFEIASRRWHYSANADLFAPGCYLCGIGTKRPPLFSG